VFRYKEPVIKERNRTESREVSVFEDIIITDKKNGRTSVQLRRWKDTERYPTQKRRNGKILMKRFIIFQQFF